MRLPRTRPEGVAIVACGASREDFAVKLFESHGAPPWQEVWACNHAAFVFRHDLVLAMDDLRRMARTWPAYGAALRRHDRPILTSRAYSEFPTSFAYPIREVLACIKDDTLNTTVAYAIALACARGVKRLWLYGCDFHYPEQTAREEGGQAAAYLLGIARGRFGVTVLIPASSTLLNAHQLAEGGRPLYGYDQQPARGPRRAPARAKEPA